MFVSEINQPTTEGALALLRGCETNISFLGGVSRFRRTIADRRSARDMARALSSVGPMRKTAALRHKRNRDTRCASPGRRWADFSRSEGHGVKIFAQLSAYRNFMPTTGAKAKLSWRRSSPAPLETTIRE
jgi:hypothetical protein